MAKKANADDTPQPVPRRLCFYCGGKKCQHCFGTGITANDLTAEEKAAYVKPAEETPAQ